MKIKYKRKEYWEALTIVMSHQFLGTPEYLYGWWKKRLNLIKKGII